MNQEKEREIGKIKIGANDLLFNLFDGVANTLIAATNHSPYRISKKEYAIRINERFDSRHALYYLKKRSLIKKVVQGKETYYELTKNGHEKLTWHKIENLHKGRTERWDKFSE